MKLAKVLLKILPSKWKQAFMRSLIDFGPIYTDQTQNIEVTLATRQEDLEAAYKLLHDAYVGKGLMDPEPSGLRVNIYSVLPYTSVIIAKVHGVVVGTLSLIKDSPIGFPSDKEYLKENDTLRRQGYHLIEVSALAIHNDHRRSKSGTMVSFLLMRYMYDYAEQYMGADMICATIHPTAYIFYQALFGFNRTGSITQYEFVKNALAIHISQDLKFCRKFVEEVSHKKPLHKNIDHFFTKAKLDMVKLPTRNRELHLDPTMTPEIIENIFIKKTQLLSHLPIDSLAYIKWAYELHFSLDHIQIFHQIEKRDRNFRYLSNIPTVVIGKTMHIGSTKDLSISGLFFSSSHDFGAEEQDVTVIFNLNKEAVQIRGRLVFHQGKANKRYGKGIGIQFLETQFALFEFLKNSHLLYKDLKELQKLLAQEKQSNVIDLFGSLSGPESENNNSTIKPSRKVS